MIVFFDVSKELQKHWSFFLNPLEKSRKHWKETRIVKLRQFYLDSAADSYTATFFVSVQIAFARLNRIFFFFCSMFLSE